MSKYVVSTSPHITAKNTTKSIMLDVIIALCPVVIATVVIFGVYPLFLILLSVASCVLFEWAFTAIRKSAQINKDLKALKKGEKGRVIKVFNILGEETTIHDLSAVVTGIILGLNLPGTVPIWVPIVGSAFAIIIVKMLFGGIGKNFANPAMTARVFLVLAWTGLMTQKTNVVFGTGTGYFSYFLNVVSISPGVDAVTSATPLVTVKATLESGASPLAGVNALNMFTGLIPSSAVGETCTIAILIGAIYLLVRKVIDWRIPLFYIASVVLFTALVYCKSPYVGEYILTYLLGGGLMFGAVFMATDYATSPKNWVGVIIYTLGLGLLTVIFRRFSNMPEGVSYAIVLMNIVTPLLEKIKRRPFGVPKRNYIKEISDKFKAKSKKKAAIEEGGENA